ncbi:MAG: sugar phosphate nucleotidyltransferase [Syntrophomonadales bacterium]|jgi:mannose-1-phosphate guanylyltransferase/phosphomannomutase
MKAVIMAGGESTRLRPLTCKQPKPMVPVMDRPVMEYIVELLKKHGFEEIIVTLFYLPNAISQHFGDGSQFGVKMRYFVEEFPLGTAGSVRNARRYLDETFLVISGDTLTDIDLSRVVSFHQEKEAIATLALSRVDNPLEYGIVMTDEEGRITRFLEKPSWAAAFSDLANTGIYVLEPEIFDYFEDKQVFDFSKDLFPLLMAKQQRLYATLCPEYWCDIGGIQQYRQANYDILNGLVKVNIDAPQVRDGVYIGEGATIPPDARIEAPCYIGQGSHIKRGVTVGPYSVIGKGSTLNEGVSLKRSILWNKVFAGRKTELRGTVVCNNAVLKGHNTVLEGAVIGDDSVLGADSTVRMDVRIWPEKNIEQGSNVSSNVIWGTRMSKFLFGARGVSGLINLEITPEFLAKLGAAYGTLLGDGKSVAVGCDSLNASKMLKRAFSAGVLSTGVNVYDLGMATSGIVRYTTRLLQADGGVQIRQSPDDDTALLVEFFDRRGLNIHANTRRKLENIFTREAFARTDAEGVGETVFFSNVIAQYIEGVMHTTDFRVISDARFQVALYYDARNFTSFLPVLLSRIGCQIITPEGLEEGCGVKTLEDIAGGIEILKETVIKNHADMGVLIDQNADRLVLIDEKGEVITDEQMVILVCFLLLKFTRRQAVPVPVAAPRVIEKLAHEYDGLVLKAQEVNTGLIVTGVTETKVLFEGDEMPEFQIMCDAISSLVKILELMGRENLSLSGLVSTMPNFYLDRQEVHIPADEKARVMRMLLEKFKDDQLELTEGIKILHDEGWSLVLPDDEEPLFTIYTEASSLEKANEITRNYVSMINQLRFLEGKLQVGS